MSEINKFARNFRAINKNDQIKRLRTFGDRLSDKITAIAGSTIFLVLNVVWFVMWILTNMGVFGHERIFDEYPFGFLTMVVSLEAIILSIFVLVSQNRQSRHSEIRSEMDYITDLQADTEINTILAMLTRLADKQGVDMSDLLEELDVSQKKILRAHPTSEKDLED